MYLVNYIYYCLYKLHNCTRYTLHNVTGTLCPLSLARRASWCNYQRAINCGGGSYIWITGTMNCLFAIIYCTLCYNRHKGSCNGLSCTWTTALIWSNELSVFAIISTPLPSFRKIDYKYYIVLPKVPAFKINTDPDLVNCMCQISPPQLCLMFKAHIRLHNASSNRYDD